MRITVLGCDGSIAGERRTTCYRVDDDILIDAGTGAGDLSLDQAIAIDHVFLTHAHLDHCCMLPMLADAAGARRKAPLIVHALPDTLSTLKLHLFNGMLWPDYTAIPSPEQPFITFSPITPGVPVTLHGRTITPLPARHAIPAVGYAVNNSEGCWVCSGDTTLCEEFWQALNNISNLRHLLIENTFLNARTKEAISSGHMTADLLAQGLRILRQSPELYIVHMEAGQEEATMHEVGIALPEHKPYRLERGHTFDMGTGG